MTQMNLSMRQKKTWRPREQTYGCQNSGGEGREGHQVQQQGVCAALIRIYLSHTYVYVKILVIKTSEGARGLAEEDLRCFLS